MRGDVQACKEVKSTSSVMANAFSLFADNDAAYYGCTSEEMCRRLVTQRRQVQTVSQKVKTSASKAIKAITPTKATSAAMMKAYKKYLRKNVSK